MQQRTLILFFIFLFTGCSHPPAVNTWQYDAASAMQAYEKHFLQKHLLRAKSDLSRARSSASQSADLHTRIDIELSVCALNLSILKADLCENASALLQIEPNDSQSAYLHLLRSELKTEQISSLPVQYRPFAEAIADNDTLAINTQIRQIRPLSSRLVVSALAQEQISNENIEGLITELSYHGYKNPLLAWLKVQMNNETDLHKKVKLRAKIAVLASE